MDGHRGQIFCTIYKFIKFDTFVLIKFSLNDKLSHIFNEKKNILKYFNIYTDNSTHFAFFSNTCLMEGRAATMRAGLVMAPVDLSWGTLKSHLENRTS